MNIYLDIDGVLLVNENTLANGAEDFLKAVLAKYPDSTYWLTTHCWQGDNRAVAVLAPFLSAETTELIGRVRPTNWGDWKTDAIDYSQPFLWFDDDLYPEEKEALEAHGALGGHVLVNLSQDTNRLVALAQKYFS